MLDSVEELFSPELTNVCVQDPRVLDAMLPYQVNYYGNPHSRTHAYGWESESAMEVARKVNRQSFLFCKCCKEHLISIMFFIPWRLSLIEQH